MKDGSIVIADQADGMLRIVDGTGRVRRSWGRVGDGPGEFRSLSWVSACGGDSLYVWDARALRLSVIHPVTGYVRQMSAPASAGAITAACDDQGNVAMFSAIAPRSGGTSTTSEKRTADGRTYTSGTVWSHLVVRDRSGDTVQELRDVSYGEMLMGQLGPGGGMGAMPRPLGALTAFALVDDQLVVARSDSGTMTFYPRDGRKQRSVLLPVVRGVPSVAQYEAAISRTVEAAPPPARSSLVSFAKQVPRPTTHRAFSQLLAGRNGVVWFVTSVPGDAVTRLRAHDRTGAVTRTLEVNTAMEVFEVGANYVLGRTESADGEQRVVVFTFAG
jgi:hypothetical protein